MDNRCLNIFPVTFGDCKLYTLTILLLIRGVFLDKGILSACWRGSVWGVIWRLRSGLLVVHKLSTATLLFYSQLHELIGGLYVRINALRIKARSLLASSPHLCITIRPTWVIKGIGKSLWSLIFLYNSALQAATPIPAPICLTIDQNMLCQFHPRNRPAAEITKVIDFLRKTRFSEIQVTADVATNTIWVSLAPQQKLNFIQALTELDQPIPNLSLNYYLIRSSETLDQTDFRKLSFNISSAKPSVSPNEEFNLNMATKNHHIALPTNFNINLALGHNHNKSQIKLIKHVQLLLANNSISKVTIEIPASAPPVGRPKVKKGSKKLKPSRPNTLINLNCIATKLARDRYHLTISSADSMAKTTTLNAALGSQHLVLTNTVYLQSEQAQLIAMITERLNNRTKNDKFGGLGSEHGNSNQQDNVYLVVEIHEEYEGNNLPAAALPQQPKARSSVQNARGIATPRQTILV